MIFEQLYTYNCPDIHTGNNPSSGCLPEFVFDQIRPKELTINIHYGNRCSFDGIFFEDPHETS